ncbi:MAG: ATP-binding protein [Anaerolineae bacterium]
MRSLQKVTLILGARRVGKTTLLRELTARLEQQGWRVRYLNCDLEEERRAANTTSRVLLDRLAQGMDAVFLDEAQRLDDPGLTLKALYDLYPQLTIVATGSSSFDLRNRAGDPLTGRHLSYDLWPLSLAELLGAAGVLEDPALSRPHADSLLPSLMTYGSYPEVHLEPNPATKRLLLGQLVESYLFRDVFSSQRVRRSQAVRDLARALAYQVGREVSEQELARRLGIDRKTVAGYLDLLEQSCVIFRLPPYSRNPRREIGGMCKVYFVDLGIRNALIGDYNDLAVRADLGHLWENFLIAERLKSYAARGESLRAHFWRSYGGAEVDYLEENAGALRAYELKWGEGKLSRGAHAFEAAYGEALRNRPGDAAGNVELVSRDNYLDFALGLA